MAKEFYMGFPLPDQSNRELPLGAFVHIAPTQNKKESNPKDSVATKKPGISCIPLPVLMELGVGLLEGARKYGRHNYRATPVRASVYIDATFRHIAQWYEGEDIDPDSGLSHITKAIASLVVLRDGMMQGKFVDDRPPQSSPEWLRSMQPQVEELFVKYPNAEKAYTQKDVDNV